MPERVLVTGASGFVGGHLMTRLAAEPSVAVRGAVRKKLQGDDSRRIAVGEINGDTDWSEALKGQHAIVHTAARAHIMDDEAADPLTEFRSVNVAGTLNLARQAAAAGVERFVFISSIKVNGEHTTSGQCFTADDVPAPEDPYGISKREAEEGLQHIAEETGLEVVIIRPPLVYGQGVKGNFANMTKLIVKGIPLPLGAIHNNRSLVALDNLMDLIINCIDNPAAANQVFLVSDGEDLSTSELLRCVGKAMGQPARLLPVPAELLQFGAMVLGKKAMAQRLLGSLQVDISKTRELLGWEPPVSVDEGLRRCFKINQDG
ncbi:UDP-glucose 4-epimerase family protein [Marinobacter apostichopi]|uniref:UDP-glucose 4-epimerase family protein n=1 Tax=Marinobacter apostichopi TaxID=3035454 RepID=UPI0025725FE6|nr:SDR family oxidoreductase [Marinobacter sp. LA51]